MYNVQYTVYNLHCTYTDCVMETVRKRTLLISLQLINPKFSLKNNFYWTRSRTFRSYQNQDEIIISEVIIFLKVTTFQLFSSDCITLKNIPFFLNVYSTNKYMSILLSCMHCRVIDLEKQDQTLFWITTASDDWKSYCQSSSLLVKGDNYRPGRQRLY